MGRHLGLDLSTQSLTATVIDVDARAVVHRSTLAFGDALPEYASPNGFLVDPDPRTRHADPRMWARALELLLARAAADGMDWSTVAGVSGAAQQHGTVYLRGPLRTDRAAGGGLTGSVERALSRPTAPIWLDMSTSRQCTEIAVAAGGADAVARISGSRPTERFAGPQIRRFWEDEPASYAATRTIALISSFGASLVLGSQAPIDRADATGMNLLELATGAWSSDLLVATAPRLAPRLGAPIDSGTVLGPVSAHLRDAFGFAAGAQAVAWTGDNPSSLVGCGAIAEGTLVISLGTSDTVFAPIAEPRIHPGGTGHTFGNPAGGFFGIEAFSNGALARSAVADRLGLDWASFEAALIDGSEPGNGGNLMVPYFAPEITPRVAEPEVLLLGDDTFRAWGRSAAAARAVVEGQALAMRRASRRLVAEPRLVLVTGGGAGNAGIRQVLADVFGAPVRRVRDPDTVALGAALISAHALGEAGWDDLLGAFAAPDPTFDAAPRPGLRDRYAALERRFAQAVEERFGVTRESDNRR